MDFALKLISAEYYSDYKSIISGDPLHQKSKIKKFLKNLANQTRLLQKTFRARTGDLNATMKPDLKLKPCIHFTMMDAYDSQSHNPNMRTVL